MWRANPCSSMGKVESQLEAPFSASVDSAHRRSRVSDRSWVAITAAAASVGIALTAEAALMTAAGWRSPQQPHRSPSVGGTHHSSLVCRRSWVALTAAASAAVTDKGAAAQLLGCCGDHHSSTPPTAVSAAQLLRPTRLRHPAAATDEAAAFFFFFFGGYKKSIDCKIYTQCNKKPK